MNTLKVQAEICVVDRRIPGKDGHPDHIALSHLFGSFCFTCTVDPRYNDIACYQKFGCEIEFAVIKKLDMDLSKA